MFTGLTANTSVTITPFNTAGVVINNASGVLATEQQLAPLRGGTGVDASTAPNGALLIGNGSGFSLNTISGTSNQVLVTNGSGTIALSLPQDIAATSSPTFASINLANTTNQIVLGTTNTTTINSIAPVASRFATIPSLSADVTFVFENQT